MDLEQFRLDHARYVAIYADTTLKSRPKYEGNMAFSNLPKMSTSKWATYPIAVLVVQVVERTSKKGTAYYVATVKDDAGFVGKVTVWEKDYHDHAELLQPGSYARIRVRLPEPPYTFFTLSAKPVPPVGI